MLLRKGYTFLRFHQNYFFRAEYDLFQIELSKSYGITEWKEDIKKLLMKAGVENKPMVFLFVDTQVSKFDISLVKCQVV